MIRFAFTSICGRITVLTIAATFVAGRAFGQFGGPATQASGSIYDAARAAMVERTEADRRAAAGNADIKAWDFVVADRRAKTVTVHACATNIRPADPVEFFLNTVASGKDYESLAVTFAKPADVAAALKFIEVKPGRPIEPRQNRYWSRGPRMILDFAVGDPAVPPVRAESLVVTPENGKPLPAAGNIYTGSAFAPLTGIDRRVAETNDAGPIAAVYNEPAALFDVPTQAPQSEVYGRRKPGPAFTAKPGDLIDVRFAAATGENVVTEADLFVMIDAEAGRPRYSFAVTKRDSFPVEPKVYQAANLPNLLGQLAAIVDGKSDYFTTVRIAADTRVADARNLFAVLRAIEQDRGIKLDAPPDGELFHSAFFPDPAWRDRGTRLGEPWELFLTRNAAGKITATLERQSEDPDATPRVRIESTQPADPAAMAAHVAANESKWSKTLFVYPPTDLTYGELKAWTNPVTTALPRVFVFPPDATTSRPTTASN